MYGIGGDIGELDELLGEILEAQKDWQDEMNATKIDRTSRESQKEVVGQKLMGAVQSLK